MALNHLKYQAGRVGLKPAVLLHRLDHLRAARSSLILALAPARPPRRRIQPKCTLNRGRARIIAVEEEEEGALTSSLLVVLCNQFSACSSWLRNHEAILGAGIKQGRSRAEVAFLEDTELLRISASASSLQISAAPCKVEILEAEYSPLDIQMKT